MLQANIPRAKLLLIENLVENPKNLFEIIFNNSFFLFIAKEINRYFSQTQHSNVKSNGRFVGAKIMRPPDDQPTKSL